MGSPALAARRPWPGPPPPLPGPQRLPPSAPPGAGRQLGTPPPLRCPPAHAQTPRGDLFARTGQGPLGLQAHGAEAGVALKRLHLYRQRNKRCQGRGGHAPPHLRPRLCLLRPPLPLRPVKLAPLQLLLCFSQPAARLLAIVPRLCGGNGGASKPKRLLGFCSTQALAGQQFNHGGPERRQARASHLPAAARGARWRPPPRRPAPAPAPAPPAAAPPGRSPPPPSAAAAPPAQTPAA